MGSLYRGNRISLLHFAHLKSSTRLASNASSSLVGEPIPVLTDAEPQTSQSGWSTHLNDFLNQYSSCKSMASAFSAPETSLLPSLAKATRASSSLQLIKGKSSTRRVLSCYIFIHRPSVKVGQQLRFKSFPDRSCVSKRPLRRISVRVNSILQFQSPSQLLIQNCNTLQIQCWWDPGRWIRGYGTFLLFFFFSSSFSTRVRKRWPVRMSESPTSFWFSGNTPETEKSWTFKGSYPSSLS